MTTVMLETFSEGYAIITLNRPEAKNALSRQLREEFVDAFDVCHSKADIRAVILTGSGDSFCAGFDLKEMGQEVNTNTAEEVNNAVAEAMVRFDGTIIGAINGHCITGGFEMALACDILVASESARFADTHARVGMLPGWGLSQKLPRLIGLSRAREIAFTGAPIDAQRAYEWGLVNHVLPKGDLLPKCIEIAVNICACDPHVLARYKNLIELGYSMPLNQALQWEEAQATEWARRATGDMIEARRASVMAKARREHADPDAE
ncbi:MAG: enoyl-CoA hydratase [Pseudomonadota bacterium]